MLLFAKCGVTTEEDSTVSEVELQGSLFLFSQAKLGWAGMGWNGIAWHAMAWAGLG